MTAPFFHVGILVRDIEQASAAFAEALCVEFEPVRSSPVASGDVVVYRYSLQGPPYLELVQMTGTGLFAEEHGEGVHHIGIARDDVPGRCSFFADRGFGPEASVTTADGAPRVFFTDPSALHGVRLEHLDLGVFAAVEARVHEARSA